MSSILNNLSDREILLLTYQKVEGVAVEFKEYKKEQAMQYHELDKRITEIERLIQRSEAIKEENDKQRKRQLTILGVIITAANVIVSLILKYFV